MDSPLVNIDIAPKILTLLMSVAGLASSFIVNGQCQYPQKFNVNVTTLNIIAHVWIPFALLISRKAEVIFFEQEWLDISHYSNYCSEI